jgi:hypothetical protein
MANSATGIASRPMVPVTGMPRADVAAGELL